MPVRLTGNKSVRRISSSMSIIMRTMLNLTRYEPVNKPATLRDYNGDREAAERKVERKQIEWQRKQQTMPGDK